MQSTPTITDQRMLTGPNLCSKSIQSLFFLQGCRVWENLTGGKTTYCMDWSTMLGQEALQ